jgi:hypothetical protein
VVGTLGFLAEVSLDSLLIGGILGGDVQELPHHAWGLKAKRVDERLASHATNEGVDHISVGDVWELIALVGEAPNALPEGLVGPLPAVMEILGVP